MFSRKLSGATAAVALAESVIESFTKSSASALKLAQIDNPLKRLETYASDDQLGGWLRDASGALTEEGTELTTSWAATTSSLKAIRAIVSLLAATESTMDEISGALSDCAGCKLSASKWVAEQIMHKLMKALGSSQNWSSGCNLVSLDLAAAYLESVLGASACAALNPGRWADSDAESKKSLHHGLLLDALNLSTADKNEIGLVREARQSA
jgi:hypothetical protein